MKKLLLILFLVTPLSFAQLLLEENFNYGTTDNPDITSLTSSWIRHSGIQGPAYVAAGLNYVGYPSSGIGGALSFTNGSSGVNDGDIHRKFSDSVTTAQNIYAFFMLNLASARTTSDYFFHLGPYTIGTTFRGRVYARNFGSGYVVGLGKSSETRTEDSSIVFNYNQTYLFVLKYIFNPAAADDDQVVLYAYDNTFPLTEPGSPILTIGPIGTGVGSDPANIGAVAIRQGTNSPTGLVDGIRIATDWNSIVPVELTSFNATVSGTNVLLKWTTATEVNNSGFDVERKTSNSDWKKIGFVPGAGTISEKQSYTFSDKNLNKGRYQYRLRQIDFDGTFEYSKVVEVEVISPSKFELAQNYPNPFNPTTAISFTIPQSGNVKLAVYNLLGQEVAVLVNEFREAGTYDVGFNASNLNSGVYLYKLEVNGLTFTKKMTLLK
ncbi:Fibronectin type III domain protein [Ignavibacterium album JCM 16511]|uniref:Fibronectin type III domain protein n=1 Tax=Ignavibacterium album (strain DSM 19864 / JCM 16511 / NBRC 101810 / Mat9-16) TaxID=945713 RepID=I0ANK9_IGNAJ|nr:T9SS type A sorting domain-containing protein [Ignavibacterium album]AFH50566.1 Fibronectin type III domain protein [Ignavibacterium album JCM 16511]